MADFLSKLRMSNLFPIGGQQGETPFGMPDLNAGSGASDMDQIFNMIHRSRDMDQQRQLNLDNEMRNRARQEERYKTGKLGGGNLQNIAQSSMTPNQGKQVLFKEDPNRITPYQRESLDIQKQRLGQTGELGQERIATTRRGQDISSRRAELAEKIAAGRATDEEKHEYALDLIEARGDVGSRQITERGDITSRQIGERGDITSRQIGERGDITSRQIGERGSEQRLTNKDKPTSSTITKSGQQVNAQQIINTRPDLAKYIKYTPEGLVQIDPNTPLNEMSMIQNILYPKSGQGKDVNLPSSSKNTAPAKPTASDLLKKYGG